MATLYTGKEVPYSRWSKENYFLAIKKVVEVYSIKLDYDINVLSTKSYKELKQMYRELQLQLDLRGRSPMAFGQKNYGNHIWSDRAGRLW